MLSRGIIAGTVAMEEAVRSYRRMGTVAVLGGVAAAALSSCALQPDTAATVGSTTITEQQVDAVIASSGNQIARDRAVQDMVLGTACKNHAAKNNISYDTAAVAQELAQRGVPAGAYLDLAALKNACLSAVAQGADTQPTETELRKLYDDVAQLNPGDPLPYEQAKQQFLQNATVTDAFAVHHIYTKITEGQDISVNPRYRTLTFPLLQTGSNNVVLKVELGEPANPAVTDAPAIVITQAPTPPAS